MNTRLRTLCIAVLLASACAGGARPAAAQSPAEIQIARQTAGEALAAYRAADYAKALSLFEQARAVYPSAQIVRMLGYSHLALEHWEKAVESMEASLTSQVGPLSADDQKDVHDQLAKALAHFGAVTVTSKVAGATVSVDGGEAKRLPLEKPLRLLEGKHTFVVRAEAHLDARAERDIAGGKPVEVALEPELAEKPAAPAPPPPPPPPPPEKKAWFPHQRTVGFVTAGAGVALGGAALVTMIAGAQLRSQVEDDVAIHKKFYGDGCQTGDPRLCAFDVQVINHEADQADLARNWSIGLGIGAGVLVATGVVFVVAAPKPKTEAAAPTTGRVACSFGAKLACGGTF